MKYETKTKKINNPDNEMIKCQVEDWESSFQSNNSRGKEMIKFISCGEQWESGVAERRRNLGKESLTLNVCRKELKKLLAQNSEIEFSLDVHPTSRESQNNVEESHVFSLLLNNIVLTKKIREGITETFDKSAQYGYAFGQVTYGRINNEDQCLYPIYIPYKDPSMGFWDKNALTRTKIDGRFCGIKRILSKSDLKRKIPMINEKKCKVTNDDNEVIEYYFRQECDADFRLLMSGRYKRVDLLTLDDENNFMTRKRLALLKSSGDIDEEFDLEKTGKIDKIFFKRICNGFDIEYPLEFPTYDLPIPYHGSFSIWTPDHPTYTIPFGYELKGAQKLLNFVNSQIATQIKNSSSTKWLMKPEHVKTPEQVLMAKEINNREGAIVLGGDISTIIEKPPANISPTLIQMSQSLKMIMDDINGIMVEPNSSDMTVLSGEALDRITKNMRLMNDEALARHIDYFNDVARLVGQMIPKIITEERPVVVKKMDGSSVTMMVNEYTGTGELRNNIKDLRNKFDYIIKAGPSDAMQKESSNKALMTACQINPQLFQDVADIFFRNSDCKDSGELSRRASAKIDPSLIKYSQGEITHDEFVQSQQQQQQKIMQAKMQAAKADPTYQATVAATAAEHRKADAFQKDADTKRIKVLGDLINNEQKNEVAFANTLLTAHQSEADHAVNLAESSLRINSEMIDKMRDVIGDDDMPLQGQTEPGAANAQGGENPNQPSPDMGGDPNAGEAGQ